MATAASLEPLWDHEAPNVMLKATWKKACACLLDGGWHVIRAKAKVPTDKLTEVEARNILPAYLVDLFKRKQEVVVRREMVLTVLMDVAGWVERMGLDGAVIRSARRSMRVSGGRNAKLFADMICSAMYYGITRISAAEFNDQADMILNTDEGYFVPRYTFRKMCESYHVPVPSISEITQHLTRDRALVAEKEMDGQLGWVVDREWMDEQLRRWQLNKSDQLKVWKV